MARFGVVWARVARKPSLVLGCQSSELLPAETKIKR